MATPLEDDYLIQSSFFVLGEASFAKNNWDTGMFYMLKAMEPAGKLKYKKAVMAANKIAASNALYKTRNIKQCIITFKLE